MSKKKNGKRIPVINSEIPLVLPEEIEELGEAEAREIGLIVEPDEVEPDEVEKTEAEKPETEKPAKTKKPSIREILAKIKRGEITVEEAEAMLPSRRKEKKELDSPELKAEIESWKTDCKYYATTGFVVTVNEKVYEIFVKIRK